MYSRELALMWEQVMCSKERTWNKTEVGVLLDHISHLQESLNTIKDNAPLVRIYLGNGEATTIMDYLSRPPTWEKRRTEIASRTSSGTGRCGECGGSYGSPSGP